MIEEFTFWTWFWILVISFVVAKLQLANNEMKVFQRREEQKYQKRQFKKMVREAMNDE